MKVTVGTDGKVMVGMDVKVTVRINIRSLEWMLRSLLGLMLGPLDGC